MTLPRCADAAGLSKDLCFACEFGTELLALLRPRETAAYNLLLISDFIFRRSISDRAMPIGKAKHRFWDRATPSAQRAEGDRDRRTGVRRLSTRSGGLWGFLRGCKGGDPEPLPRPLKGLFPFREREFLHAKHLHQFCAATAREVPLSALLRHGRHRISLRKEVIHAVFLLTFFSKKDNPCSFLCLLSFPKKIIHAVFFAYFLFQKR